MTSVIYVGPYDLVHVPALEPHVRTAYKTDDGREYDEAGVVRRGEPVDVPDDIAGSPPTAGHPEGEGYDPGSGLLAQVGVWELAASASASKAKKNVPPAPADAPEEI